MAYSLSTCTHVASTLTLFNGSLFKILPRFPFLCSVYSFFSPLLSLLCYWFLLFLNVGISISTPTATTSTPYASLFFLFSFVILCSLRISISIFVHVFSFQTNNSNFYFVFLIFYHFLPLDQPTTRSCCIIYLFIPTFFLYDAVFPQSSHYHH